MVPQLKDCMSDVHLHALTTGLPSVAGDSTGQYRGVVDCFAKTFQKEGLRAFYNGYNMNLLCHHSAVW